MARRIVTRTATATDDPLLTTEQVAAIIHVQVPTLHQWAWERNCGRGRGPRGFKVGRRTLYRSSEITRWLAAQEAAAAAGD